MTLPILSWDKMPTNLNHTHPLFWLIAWHDKEGRISESGLWSEGDCSVKNRHFRCSYPSNWKLEHPCSPGLCVGANRDAASGHGFIVHQLSRFIWRKRKNRSTFRPRRNVGWFYSCCKCMYCTNTPTFFFNTLL